MVGSGGAGRSAFPVWSWLEQRLVLTHAYGVTAALIPFFTLTAFRAARGTSPLKSSGTVSFQTSINSRAIPIPVRQLFPAYCVLWNKATASEDFLVEEQVAKSI